MATTTEPADINGDGSQPEMYFDNSDSDSDSSSTAGDIGDIRDTSEEGTVTNVQVNGATHSNSKSGYLYKQGGVKRDQGWKRRYMKFDGKTLSYSKNQNSTASLRIIPVAIMVDVRPLGDGRRASTSSLFSSARAHQFELECTNRVFQFGTDDNTNAQQWQSFLMASILAHKKLGSKQMDGGKMCEPDMCGSIKFDKKGKKFFVAIKGDTLRYYYNEQDYKLDTPIHQLSMQLCSIKALPQEPTKLQLSSPPHQQFVLNFESVEEATQWELGMTDAIEEVLGDNEALESVQENITNRTCADCGSPRARFASINFGIVLCAKCAGIHRGFGATVSKVRSLRMDEIFKRNENVKQLFRVIGNANGNAFWYKTPPSDFTPNKDMVVADRKSYLTRKYLKRAFADIQQDEQEELNKLFLASVRVNDVQKTMTCLFSGAEITHQSEEGKTAIQIAESLGHTVLKEFLVQNENIDLPAQFKLSNGHVQMNNVSKKTGIYYEGYLEKTGPNMRGFKKRWFVLHYGILTYYKERGNTSPKGTIQIIDGVVSVSTSLSTERDHCFEISNKAKARVYRFAAPDADSRTSWMSALLKVVCPTEILCEQLEECHNLAIAGYFYLKFEQGTWTRAWLTLRGNRIDVWSTINMSHCLTIIITKTTKLYRLNSGRSSKLLNTDDDFRLLEGNQFVEIIHNTKITRFQGILSKDTEKLYTIVDKYLASVEIRR